MRKTIVIFSLFAMVVLLCADDLHARGRRGRGCSDDVYYSYGPGGYDGRAYDGSDPYQRADWMATETRQSYYYDPAYQRSARFMVVLPNQDAEVWFDGAVTRQRGLERSYFSSDIDGDRYYTVKARWMEGGKSVERERRVQVRGGQSYTVDFRTEAPDKLPNPKQLKEPAKGKESPIAVEVDQPRDGKGDMKMPLIKIDGEWTPVYVEMDGKKVDMKSFTNVSIKNNIVTCRHEGKEKTIRMEFGPHHMIRCTEQNGNKAITEPTEKREAHTHHGIYIASQDYFCLCLNKGPDRRLGTREEGKDREAQPRPTDRWEGHGPYGSAMVIILRRTGTTGPDSR